MLAAPDVDTVSMAAARQTPEEARSTAKVLLIYKPPNCPDVRC
jgi:hypothetical protein